MKEVFGKIVSRSSGEVVISPAPDNDPQVKAIKNRIDEMKDKTNSFCGNKGCVYNEKHTHYYKNGIDHVLLFDDMI